MFRYDVENYRWERTVNRQQAEYATVVGQQQFPAPGGRPTAPGETDVAADD